MNTKKGTSGRARARDINAAIQDCATILNTINDAVFVYESNEPGPPGKFIYVNDAAVVLTEYSRDELAALTPMDIVAHITIGDFKSFRSEFIRTGRFIKEVTFQTKTGRTIPVEINARRTIIDGRNIGLTVARDITARVEGKARLRDMENMYHIYLTNVRDILFFINTNSVFTNVSPSVEDFLGYRPEDFIGKTTRECLFMFHPDDHKKALHAASRLMRGEEMSPNVYALVTKDGRDVYGEIKSTPLVHDGSAKGFVAAMRDITDRVKTEQALRESEERFRLLHEASFGGIGVNDKGVIMEVNQALCEMTGYGYSELIGMDGMKLIAPECFDFVKKKLLSEYEKPYEAVGLRKDGSRYPLEIQGKMIPYHGKRIRVTEFRDITGLRKAEKALQESELRFGYLAMNVPVGVIQIDLVNDRIVEVNDRLCEVSGYTREELLATPSSVFFTPDSITKRKQRIGAIEQGVPVPTEFEYELNCKGGVRKWFIVRMRHEMERGKLSSVTAVMNDITERKSKERMIEGRLRELEGELADKKDELKHMNRDLLAGKGDLDRITGEYESIRQQVIENKNAIVTLAKNMGDIRREAEAEIIMNLKKIQLPILERMANDRKLASYKNDVDFLIRQFSLESPLHSEKSRIIHSLTPGELQIAAQIGRGMSSEEIASYLNISLNTVKTHRKNIRKKLGLQDSKANLVSFLQSHL